LDRHFGDSRHLTAERRGHGDTPGAAAAILGLKGSALPAACQFGNRFKQVSVTRTVGQQTVAQLIGIMPPDIGHFVEEGFIKEIIHGMPDRAPEADDRRIIYMDMPDATVL